MAVLSEENSSSETLSTYTWPDNGVANAALMQFDLSSIATGAVIQKATLRLSLLAADTKPDTTYRVTVHKIVNKNPDLSKATSDTYDGVHSWSASSQRPHPAHTIKARLPATDHAYISPQP